MFMIGSACNFGFSSLSIFIYLHVARTVSLRGIEPREGYAKNVIPILVEIPLEGDV